MCAMEIDNVQNIPLWYKEYHMILMIIMDNWQVSQSLGDGQNVHNNAHPYKSWKQKMKKYEQNKINK